MNQLDLPARAPDRNVGALSVDAQWVADKLSEYGFKMVDLEALYPAAETVAMEWAARGDELISIDLVTGEMRRRFGLKFSNTVRPFLARMLRDRRSSLRAKIEVTTTSRGKNRNVKVAIDHLNVVAVIHRASDGSEQRIELAEVPAVVERIKAAQKQNERRKPTPPAESSSRATAFGVKTPTCSQLCVERLAISINLSFGRSVPCITRTSITTPT